MNDLTIQELDTIHAALIMRERMLTEDWIPAYSKSQDTQRLEELKAELAVIPGLRKRVCCEKLSLELGFEVEPISYNYT